MSYGYEASTATYRYLVSSRSWPLAFQTSHKPCRHLAHICQCALYRKQETTNLIPPNRSLLSQGHSGGRGGGCSWPHSQAMFPPPTWPGNEAKIFKLKAKQELVYFLLLDCKDCQVVKSYVGRWDGLNSNKPCTLIFQSHFIRASMEPSHGGIVQQVI